MQYRQPIDANKMIDTNVSTEEFVENNHINR